MTSRDLVRAALAGKPTPRFPSGPLAVHVTAVLAGVSMRDYTLKPSVMADCVARYWERFRPDAVWVSADTWICAEAMGARVAFASDDQPMSGTGEPVVKSASDIDRIPPPDPASRGRIPVMLEAIALLRKRLGDEVFIVGCFDQSPFSLACSLAGINETMLKLHDDRPFVDALLERCIEHASAYANALGRAGSDMVSTGDSPAGLIGPELYRDVALPAEQRVFQNVRRGCRVPSSLHICGRTTHILRDMAKSGADVLEIDHAVDLGEACRIVPDEIALWGNLDPVGLLLQGTPAEIEAAARGAIAAVRASGRTRFVLSSGCTFAPHTPPANIEALVRSARAVG
jgi:uroporphyrinogen decarboxylase